MGKPRRTAWWLGALAGTGVLSSHWAAYAMAAPDDHHRARLLETSGHGYWPYALSLIVACLVVGLAGFVASQIGDRGARSAGTRSGLFRLAGPRLLALQVGGFVLLEASERVLAGGHAPLDLLGEPAFLIGLAVQAVVALFGAALLAGLAYVVQRVLRRARGPAHREISVPRFVSLVARRRVLPATGAFTLRGPPGL